jgi:hypothetical protein
MGDMGVPIAGRPSAEVAELPRWIAPQLTQVVAAAPEGDDWLHAKG